MASIGGDTNQLLRRFINRRKRGRVDTGTPSPTGKTATYRPRKQGTDFKPRKQGY